jgi:hypothetical protein
MRPGDKGTDDSCRTQLHDELARVCRVNRHIDASGALIARPNDRDWTGTYSRIRGPIWVPRDSGYDTGLQPFRITSIS